MLPRICWTLFLARRVQVLHNCEKRRVVSECHNTAAPNHAAVAHCPNSASVPPCGQTTTCFDTGQHRSPHTSLGQPSHIPRAVSLPSRQHATFWSDPERLSSAAIRCTEQNQQLCCSRGSGGTVETKHRAEEPHCCYCSFGNTNHELPRGLTY